MTTDTNIAAGSAGSKDIFKSFMEAVEAIRHDAEAGKRDQAIKDVGYLARILVAECDQNQQWFSTVMADFRRAGKSAAEINKFSITASPHDRKNRTVRAITNNNKADIKRNLEGMASLGARLHEANLALLELHEKETKEAQKNPWKSSVASSKWGYATFSGIKPSRY